MESPSATLRWRVLGLIAAGALLVNFVTVSQKPEFSNFALGVLFGTLLQHALLAASWVGLGPGPLGTRLRWSLVWVALIAASFAVPALSLVADQGIFPIVVLLFVLWFVGQIPAWLLARLLKMQIAIPATGNGQASSQFGLRHLLIFTFIVCVLLGIGRAIFTSGWVLGAQDYGLTLLLVAQVLLQFPLATGALLQRSAFVGIGAGLLLVAAMTVGEIEVLRQLTQGVRVTALYWLNGTAAAWTLAFALAVRSCGYRLIMMTNQPVPLPGDRI